MKKNPLTTLDPSKSTSNNPLPDNITMSLSIARNVLLISYSLIFVAYLLQSEKSPLVTKNEKFVILLTAVCVMCSLSGIPFVYQLLRTRFNRIEKVLPREEILSSIIFAVFVIETITYYLVTTAPESRGTINKKPYLNFTTFRYIASRVLFYIILFYIYHLYDNQRSSHEEIEKSNTFTHSFSMSPLDIDQSISRLRLNKPKSTLSTKIPFSVLDIIQSWSCFKFTSSTKTMLNILFNEEELNNVLNNFDDRRVNKVSRRSRHSSVCSELFTISEDEEEEYEYNEDEWSVGSKEFECESTTESEEDECRDSGYEENLSCTSESARSLIELKTESEKNDESMDNNCNESVQSPIVAEISRDYIERDNGIFFYRIIKNRGNQTLCIERSTRANETFI